MVVKIRVPFLGTLNNGCRIVLRTQKGTLILTTAHMLGFRDFSVLYGCSYFVGIEEPGAL